MKLKPILVVEDDQDIRENLVLALENEGYSVTDAINGKKALAALAQMNVLPGLILLDLMMDEMNGREFLEKIRRDHATTWAQIPVIVASAAGSGNMENLPPTAGNIKKPINLDDLLAIAAKFCEEI